MSELQLNTQEQQASYGIGLQMGEQLAANPFDGLSITAVSQGIADAFAGAESKVAQADLQAAFEVVSARMQAAAAQQAEILGAAGAEFLAENAKKEGVVTTESGLQYEIITVGEGEKPTAESTVSVHYHGSLTDGTVFDSSVDRGQPAEFPVGGVIAGWTEALQLMTVGSKYRLVVPAALAYGERGAGAAIAPHSVLVFDVELLAIK
ncbi:FKBP-type peptidyl-prolyl cis-trans isomerase [Psychromonas antarctica]|jgi:FKBP-type peptidyl-prolyl cis-trans isomerase FklB|uniref:FKBP-type peptidyl-prolyl cis-trans isomerase n=1 Tax=Psychromonas antarctica TaxID=67573 RepID=UPI001EE8F2A8|nr:FKBP-type peptidyl-prolyl cis-trans isomerase [Psychromonas antarctica]MCG6202565.1 FKBP-type peptidyl-prolyl cis-trans isomerase [Psychromonas antarctica]